ncbi:hypothetical protein B0H66DRAFT_567962 [Apodospora peruviana]|uniref:Uncharacterized protein n=1 Tax=Apodospora peruviana TaxID=516989 RepID=A0AAE0HWS6_9PEZI|nr:hypothetical protein B0H66DRAFT_567962 [Apodospora peruviana]
MRSHPYTTPPPLPPLLDEIADELVSILPNQGPPRRRASDDTEIEMCELDHDSSRLLPVRQKRHHVRVQGKLVLVRSVSTTNLRLSKRMSTMPPTPPLPLDSPHMASSGNLTSPRYESAVGSSYAPKRSSRRRRNKSRRKSLDDGSAMTDDTETESETEEEVRETVIRDRQLRGYGIGGAGNIRRPTEVIHFPARRSTPSMMLFSSVLPPSPSSPLTPTTPSTPERRRWNLREMFGLTAGGPDRKGKARAVAEL